MNLKKNIGKVVTSEFVGTGPSSYKRIYRAAVSQRLGNTALYQRELFKKIPRLGTFCTQSINEGLIPAPMAAGSYCALRFLYLSGNNFPYPLDRVKPTANFFVVRISLTQPAMSYLLL